MLAADCPGPVPPKIDDLTDPPELVGEGEEMRGTLTIAPAEITVRGCKIVSNVINGDCIPNERWQRWRAARRAVVTRAHARSFL